MIPVFNPDGSYDYRYSAFHYEPSVAAAAAMVAVFFVAFVLHLFFTVRHKAPYMISLTVGCIVESAGFGARILAHDSPFDAGTYAVQQTLILFPPVFYAATLYLVLKHIILAVDPSLSPLKPKLISVVFVGFDVLSFFVQGGASGIIVSAGTNLNTLNIGIKVLIVGLMIQVVSFLGFLALGAAFYFRARAAGRADPRSEQWLPIFGVEAVCGVLVFVRSVFRVIELWEGFDGTIAKIEWLMYVFDPGFMAVVVYLLAWYHPGRTLGGSRRLGVDGAEAQESFELGKN
ncbi:RTA1 like protein-domain-containing protein [Zopfochytrium polystomum]|nr:RTA1 like protein-domain-containing protein [Zopfochytrium polystomum]